jgi:hypothetical protein
MDRKRPILGNAVPLPKLAGVAELGIRAIVVGGWGILRGDHGRK